MRCFTILHHFIFQEEKAKSTHGGKKDLTIEPTQTGSLHLQVTQVGGIAGDPKSNSHNPSLNIEERPKEVLIMPEKTLNFKVDAENAKLKAKNLTDKTQTKKI